MDRSLYAPIRPVDSTWGPRQRSTKGPDVYVVSVSSGGRSSMSSSLNDWPCSRNCLEQLGALVLRVLEGVVRRHVLAHQRFELLQVVGRERAREQEVVVETLVRGRSDAELGIRKDVEPGRGQHVRGGVPHAGERVVHERDLSSGEGRAETGRENKIARRCRAWPPRRGALAAAQRGLGSDADLTQWRANASTANDHGGMLSQPLGLPFELQLADHHRVAGLGAGLLEAGGDAAAVEAALEIVDGVRRVELEAVAPAARARGRG